MKRITLPSIILILCVASTLILANETKKNLFIGLYGGYGMPVAGWLKENVSDNVTSKKKSRSIAAGASLGYDLRLNDMLSFGAEINGQYFFKQKFTVTNNMTGATGEGRNKLYSGMLFLTGKFYIPESNGLNLFAKAGYALHKFQGDRTCMKFLYRPVLASGIGYSIENINIFLKGQYNFLPYRKQNGGHGSLFLGASYSLPHIIQQFSNVF